MARPPKYNKPKVMQTIFDRMQEGESLSAICKDVELPTRKTVHEWLTEDKPLSDRYARAVLDRADTIFDEMIGIIDDCEEDKNAISKAVAKINTRKWIISKMNHTKYGDKLTQDTNVTIERSLIWD